MSQYQEMEQTVYNSLFTLIKDTCVLRDYVAAAILIVQASGGPRSRASISPAAHCWLRLHTASGGMSTAAHVKQCVAHSGRTSSC
jgi:hypothetical protein